MNENERDFKSRKVSNGDKEHQMRSENPKSQIQNQEAMIAALKDSEERYKALFERQLEAVYICDFEGNFLDANPAALNMLGYDKKEIKALNFETLIDPSQIPQAFKTMKEIAETGSQKDLKEYKIRHKNGYYLDIETKGSLIYHDGEPYAIQGTARDISGRKKIEEQITEQNRFLKNILESLAHPFYVINADDYTVASANSIAKQMGIIEGQTFHTSENCSEDPCHSGQHSYLLDEVKRTKAPVITEHLNKDTEGNQVYVEVHAYPIFNSQGEVERVIEYRLDISERKKIDRVIKESEQRYRRITELSFDGIAIHSEGKVVFVNPIGAKLMGAENPEQILGMPVFNFIHPDYREIAAERMKAVLEEGRPAESGEEKFIRLDGVPIDVEVLGIPITYQNKPSVQLVFRDITERKRAEQLLKQSEEKFRKYFQHQPDYCYMVSPEGKILDVNESALKILGYEKDELIGRPIVTIYAPENQMKMKGLFTKWKEKGSLNDEEMMIITKTNERRNVLLSAESIHDEHGRLQHSISVQRDITERKKVEEKIKMEKEKAQRYLDITPSIILALDSNGNISLLNEKGKEILECENEEVTGKNWFDTFIPENIRNEIREVFGKIMDGKIDFVENYENEVITLKGSKRAIHWYNTLLRDQRGNIIGTISSGEDITGRKEVEEALKKETMLSKTFMDAMPCFAMLLRKGSLEIVAANKVAKKAGADVGMNCHDVFWPCNEPHTFCKAQKLWETGEPQQSIIETPGVIWDAYWVPLDNETFLHYAFDITEKKKAEESLRKSKDRYRKISELVSDFVYSIRVEPDGSQVPEWSTETLSRIIGIEYAELLKQGGWQKVIYPEDLHIVAQRAQNLAKGKSDVCEYRVIAKDGTVHWVRDHGYPIWDEKEGRVVNIYGAAKDITDRKQAEKELKILSFVAKENSDSIAIINDVGIIEYVNQSLLKRKKIKYDDIVGKHWSDAVPSLSDIKNHIDDIQDAIRKGEIWNSEVREIRNNDKILWQNVKITPIRNDKGAVHHIVYMSEDITKRKQVEEQLRVISSAVEQSANSIVILDKNGIVEYANPKFLESGQFEGEKVIGKYWGTFVSSRSSLRESIHQIRDNVLKKGNAWKGEVREVLKNGETIWRDSTLFPIKDEKGEVQHSVYISEDMTEQKKAEQALLESQERLLTAQHIAHLGFWEWDLKTSELYWSDEAFRIMGHEPQEFKPTYDDFLDLIHPGDKEAFVEAVDNVMQGKSELEIDHRLRLPNGSVIFISSHGELLRDEKGTPLRMMGTMIDITNRKMAEEKLRVSEEKYRTLFNTSPEAIVLMDMDGMILDCNRATENIAGVAKEQMVGRFFFDIGVIDEKTLPKIVKEFQEIFKTNEYKPIDLQISIAGKKRWIEAYLSLLKKYNEPYALQIIVRDITERKSAEEEIKKRNEELYTLNTISSTINQTLELKEVLSEALEETISVLNVEGGLIYLAEKSKENFSPAIYYGYSKEAIETISGFSMGEGISGQAAQLGVPLFVPNLAEDAGHISSAFLKDGWDSLVSVPLKSKDEIVGVMTVSSKKKNKFKPEDIGLLRSIGNQIGVAIENARLYGMSQDELAERRRIERKISQQNKFLKSVLESLTHPFYVVNVKSNLIEVANSAARTRGLSVGSSCIDISQSSIDVQEVSGYFCPISDLVQTKEPKAVEHSFIDKTGNMIYNEVHAYPIFDEKGNVDRVIEYVVDITDRKRAEAGLKEKDAQLRSVVTSAPIVLWSLDKNGNFTLLEGKALEALGLKPGQVVGQSVFDVYSDVPQILENNKRALAGEEFSSYLEIGDLVWDITVSPLKDQQGNVMGSIGVATDITKRRRAENERAILFRELRHRVKNNLQLLSSMVDMQILRTENKVVKAKLQEIQGVIETIALIYTRAYEGSQLMGLNLNNFIEEIINASMKFKADDRLRITHIITGDQIKLNTDQALPMALIANELVFNALKHAFKGRRTGRISVSLNKTDGEFTMSIADDGVGIKKEVDLKKPDSFGLKIIKNLIDQLNGNMETVVDNGTEFIITIPVDKEV